MGIPFVSSRELQTSNIRRAEAKHDTAFNPQETRPEEQKERASEATKKDAVGIRLESSVYFLSSHRWHWSTFSFTRRQRRFSQQNPRPASLETQWRVESKGPMLKKGAAAYNGLGKVVVAVQRSRAVEAQVVVVLEPRSTQYTANLTVS
jgi:hypothetical protein